MGNFYRRVGKRLLDVALTSTALVPLAPVMVAVAGMVRAQMGAPVLFRQRRLGKDGRVFTIWKFRTMTDARDANGEPLSDQHRLTRLGVLLRKTSLDELPQLLNVLRGDMSLIGPRPLLVGYRPWYTEREQTRHEVRPGITGWAQVNGRNESSWDQRLEHDACYVERMSLGLDLKILAMTVAKVLRHENVMADNSELVPLDRWRAQQALAHRRVA